MNPLPSLLIDIGLKTFVPVRRIIYFREATEDERKKDSSVRSFIALENGITLPSICNAVIIAKRIGYIPPKRTTKKKEAQTKL